jgi:hypothetical protein
MLNIDERIGPLSFYDSTHTTDPNTIHDELRRPRRRRAQQLSTRTRPDPIERAPTSIDTDVLPRTPSPDGRNIGHVALKNVPSKGRKLAAQGVERRREASRQAKAVARDIISSRCLNRAWITEGTQSVARDRSTRVKCVHTSNSRLINILDESRACRVEAPLPRSSPTKAPVPNRLRRMSVAIRSARVLAAPG